MLTRTIFGEEHELFRDQARRFLEEEVIPHHVGWETDGIVPRAVWRKAYSEGLWNKRVAAKRLSEAERDARLALIKPTTDYANLAGCDIVVEADSFSRAAARLTLSAPMASKHVAQLERDLGARLLHRTSRKLSLTEAGAVYYAQCCEALDTL